MCLVFLNVALARSDDRNPKTVHSVLNNHLICSLLLSSDRLSATECLRHSWLSVPSSCKRNAKSNNSQNNAAKVDIALVKKQSLHCTSKISVERASISTVYFSSFSSGVNLVI